MSTATATAHHITHFAIHADEPERALAFYESVFAWRFRPWGPPDFWMIATGPEGEAEGIHGSLQKRSTPLKGGEGVRGFECTIGVDDVDAIAAAVEAHGGKIVTPKFHIVGVGWLIRFEDTEGNIVAAMDYEEGAG